MIISVSHPETYFGFFYILSFAITFILFIIFSQRKKIPLWSMLLILTTCSLFTIIGSRLCLIPVSDWGRIISTGSFQEYTGRSAVGGILFGLSALIISRKFLGLDKPIPDLYAWITPIGLGIQKLGCFFNGCCYGKPSGLPWSIQYLHGTSAHFRRVLFRSIDENSAYSLNIHPVQLYEVILLFMIAYIVCRIEKLWKKSCSSLLFSLSLFFIFRFFMEFLRDHDSSNLKSNLIAGLEVLQWLFLIFGILCILVLFVNEKYFHINYAHYQINEPSFNKSLAYILVLSSVIYLFRGLFTQFEIISLDIKFVPAILLTAYNIYKSLTLAKIRLAMTTFLVVPVLLISQAISTDSTKNRKSVRDFYKDIKTYRRVDVATSFGDFYNSVDYNPHQGECATTYTNEEYKHLISMGGVGISKIKKDEKTITTIGVNIQGGVDRVYNLTKSWEKPYFLLGINPYIKYDRKWIGMWGGINVGNLRWIPVSPINDKTFDEGTRFSPVMPEVSLRLGRRDILDLKYSYGFNFPSTFPMLLHEISIGSGFGKKNDFTIRYGFGFSKSSDLKSCSFIST